MRRSCDLRKPHRRFRMCTAWLPLGPNRASPLLPFPSTRTYQASRALSNLAAVLITSTDGGSKTYIVGLAQGTTRSPKYPVPYPLLDSQLGPKTAKNKGSTQGRVISCFIDSEVPSVPKRTSALRSIPGESDGAGHSSPCQRASARSARITRAEGLNRHRSASQARAHGPGR